ncbi:pleckstrin homology domain-containing family O member 1-A [Neosynchiropus ocellatus]
MRKSHSRRGIPDSGTPAGPQPEKAGWVRKFCGRGIFRELWRSRYVALKGDHLYLSNKEVRDEKAAQEVFDLADYERAEELRKAKSRSKKNHSRFTVLRCRQRGNKVPNLVFLAVSPEEKELWINAINIGIVKAKNRVFDEVTVEQDSVLVHPTRDRAKIPQGRRLPTRGHLTSAVSASSTLDLVAEEDGYFLEYDDAQEFWEASSGPQKGGSCGQIAEVGCQRVGGRQRAGTDVSKLQSKAKEPKVKTGSLPRGTERFFGKYSHLEVTKGSKVQPGQFRTPQPGKRSNMQARGRCSSLDQVLKSRPAMIRSELRSALRRCATEEEAGGSGEPVGQLQSLIAQRMQRAQELLEEMRLQELQKAKSEREFQKSADSPRLHQLRGTTSPYSSRSSGSSRSRSSDSARLRDSPCSKVKRNRSHGSRSPAGKASHSPRLTDISGAKNSDVIRSPLFGAHRHSAEDGGQENGDPNKTPGDEKISSEDMQTEAERKRAEAERLLVEAVSSWKEAQEVLQEVKELQSQTLRRQRRRTYEKMATTAKADDTPQSSTSHEDEESGTP